MRTGESVFTSGAMQIANIHRAGIQSAAPLNFALPSFKSVSAACRKKNPENSGKPALTVGLVQLHKANLPYLELERAHHLPDMVPERG